MNDFLSDYTKEEIEALALKQIEFEKEEEENKKFKIIKIDKEYKKHNKKAVITALSNAFVILVFVGIIANSKSSLSNIGTRELMASLEEFTQKFSNLPTGELISIIYAKMFEGLNLIMDKIGIVGTILACKSVSLFFKIFKDTKRSFEIKAELEALKNEIGNAELRNEEVKSL